MKKAIVQTTHGLPESFRPLLWSLKWENLDINKDKDDIILAAVNEGTLDQWRWIIQKYGKDVIREVLVKRLATEFHPESRNLARVVFDLPRESIAAVRGLPTLSYAR